MKCGHLKCLQVSRGDLVVKLFGDKLLELNTLGIDILNLIENTKGSEDVYMRKNDGVSYKEVIFDKNSSQNMA